MFIKYVPTTLQCSTNILFLRYLLQIMLEANCLEIATVISIVLKDALALIRIVNAARTSGDSKVCVMRLFKGMKALDQWAQNEW